VTRLFAGWRDRQIVQGRGSTLVIRNKATLHRIATSEERVHFAKHLV